jgi:5-methylcytosine-specific restriction enzyme A
MVKRKSQLYGRRWQNKRARFLRDNPLCVMCRREGHIVEATVVDHIRPHRGDEALFWDESNWQPLCKQHHDSTKQREEKHGQKFGTDINGRPLNPLHPWNKRKK